MICSAIFNIYLSRIVTDSVSSYACESSPWHAQCGRNITQVTMRCLFFFSFYFFKIKWAVFIGYLYFLLENFSQPKKHSFWLHVRGGGKGIGLQDKNNRTNYKMHFVAMFLPTKNDKMVEFVIQISILYVIVSLRNFICRFRSIFSHHINI